jgi:hypothetical protein
MKWINSKKYLLLVGVYCTSLGTLELLEKESRHDKENHLKSSRS